MKSLQVALEATEAEKIAKDAEYGAQLSGSFSYQRSNERPVIQFSPTFKPAQLASIAYNRKLEKGLNLSGQIFTEQYTTADRFIDEATRFGSRVNIELDLWKNLWGRLDKLDIKEKSLNLEKRQLENTLRSKELEIEVQALLVYCSQSNESRLE